MKKIILLLVLITLQFANAAKWEKTSWTSEYKSRFLAAEGEKMLVASAVSFVGERELNLSLDNGATWSKLEIDSLDLTDLYGYISGDNIYLHWSNNGWHFAVSTDLGKTWDYAPAGLPRYEQAVRIIFNGANMFLSFYAENSGGLYRSSDGGKNWTDIGKNVKYVASYGEFQVINDIIYLGTTSGAYLSFDFGETWQEMVDFPFLITSIRASGDQLFLLKKEKDDPHYYFITSTDKGLTWKLLNDKLPKSFSPMYFTVLGDKLFLGTMKYTINGSNAHLYMSTDKGQTWIEKNPDPFENKNVRYPFGFISSGNNLIANVQDSVCVSTNLGDSWATDIKGLPPVKYKISDLQMIDNRIFCALGNEVYASEDNGLNWIKKYGKKNYGFVGGLATLGDTLFVGSAAQGGQASNWDAVYYSTDRGDTWHGLGLVGDTTKALFSGDGKLLVRTNSSAYLTNDRGVSWSAIKDIWPDMWYVDDVAFAPGKIFAGNEYEGFKYSSDEGASWELRNEGLSIPTYKLRDLRCVDGSLYARTGSYYYFSSDDGVTWNLRNKGIEDFNENGTYFDARGSEAYASGTGGLFYTSDYGVTWTKKDIYYAGAYLGGINMLKMLDDNTIIVYLYNKGLYISSDKGDNWKGINDGIKRSWMSNPDRVIKVGEYLYCVYEAFYMGEQYQPLVKEWTIFRAKLSDLLSAEDDTQTADNFIIAPNPARDFLNIHNYTGVFAEYAITDILGRIIQTGRFTGERIGISTLQTGTYYLRVGDQMKAFIKM